MACAEMVKLNPQGNADDASYEATIRSLSSSYGQICVIGHFSAGCSAQCGQMSKNYTGCSSCLGAPESCGSVDGKGETVPCCPFVGPATACSNCLGLYNTDALAQCLKTGLSVGAIVGIVIACIVVVAIIIVIIVVVVRTQKKVELERKIGLGSDVDLKTLQEIETINQELKKYQG